MSRFERIADVLYFRTLLGSLRDAHDIEPDGDVAFEVGSNIGFRELDQLPLLLGVDRIHWAEMVIAGTGFDLDDHNGIAIPGHDVDFAEAATPAPLENLVAASFQLFGGESFAALAKVATSAPLVTPLAD